MQRTPIDVRLWARIDRSGGPEACWPWTGKPDHLGYGRINSGGHVGTPLLTHRVAWETTNGVIPTGLNVCHHCDNPPCCNPAHLFLGTQADNLRDMSAKGRNHQTRKTHCPQGHEYTHANTYLSPSGSRNCRICTEASRQRYAQGFITATRTL